MHIKQTIRKLVPKNRFARSVSFLMGGSVAAQGILLLATPVLTRLYSPESFGILAVFMSALAMLSVIAMLRYPLAIPLPSDDNDALALGVVSFGILLFFVIVISGLIFFAGDPIFKTLSLEKIRPYAWLLPITILLAGSYEIFSYWAIRRKKFPVIAATRVMQSCGSVFSQISLYVLGVLGLLVGHAISVSIGFIRLGQHFVNDSRTARAKGCSPLSRLSSVAIDYRQFPLYSTWNGFLNTAGRELPPVILAASMGPAAAGFYFLATRVVTNPISVITEATSRVFLSEAPEAHRREELGSLVAAVQNQLVKIFALPLAFYVLVAPQVYKIVFGQEWLTAGILSQILVPWLFFLAIINPISQVAGILHKQRQAFFIEVLMITARIGGLVLGIMLGSLTIAVAFFSAGAVFALAVKLWWILNVSRVEWQRIIPSYVRETAMVAGILVAGFALVLLNAEIIFWVYCAVIACFAVHRSYNALTGGIEYGANRSAW